MGSSWKGLRQSFILWTDFYFRKVTGNMVSGLDGGRNHKIEDQLGDYCKSPGKVRKGLHQGTDTGNGEELMHSRSIS